MKDNYGNLRRRTRDSSWQWLFMGTILGLGFALVICVGGYALGAITFPPLDEDTSTPNVQIAPNETEVAAQAIAAAQQTLDAQAAMETPPATDEMPEPVATTEGDETPADATEELTEPAETPADAAMDVPNATASPLPGSEPAPAEDSSPEDATPPADQAAPAEATGEPSGQAPQQATERQTQQESAPAAALAQDTPVVGTPPVGQPTQTITFGSAPAIPPELDALKTELAAVTGGTYLMGTTLEEASQARDECATYGKECQIEWASDSTPTHQVIVDGFEMEIYEVSVTQYVAFLNWLGPNSHKNMCQGQPCALTTQEQETSYINFDGETYAVRNAEFYASHPVTLVTWWGAEQYCNTLNRRLPTEAEWERAARGAQNYIYPWGFDFDTTLAMSSIAETPATVPITTYPTGASPYGIMNMAGNVEEWVQDWYQADYYAQQAANPLPNPQGPISGTEKVLRGGSWDTIPFFLRSVHRRSLPAGQPTTSTGFRCVAESNLVGVEVAPPANNAGQPAGADDAASGGAPTLAPAPTNPPAATRPPAGPTPTLAPG
jgi:formylglycine-generating enzyme required for sulfatase activity